MEPSMSDRYVTRVEAAKILGLKLAAFDARRHRRKISPGIFPYTEHVFSGSGRIYYDRTELERLSGFHPVQRRATAAA
jgi:hypothetical protein